MEREFALKLLNGVLQLVESINNKWGKATLKSTKVMRMMTAYSGNKFIFYNLEY